MSKRNTVTLGYVISVYNNMFDHMDGIIRALDEKMTQSKEELRFAVKLSWQKLSKYFAEMIPSMGMLLFSAHILDPFQKLRSYWKWDKGLGLHPEDNTFYTTQYQDAFLKYVQNENCAKHWRVMVNKPDSVPSNNLVPSATSSGSFQLSFDPHDLWSDNEEYLTPNNVA